MIDLNQFGEQWLSVKKQRMENLLKIAFPDEALYREIMLSLGYPENKTNFLNLALILPYSEIRKLKGKNIIEKALLYRAGLDNDKEGIPSDFDFSLKMDKSVWNYKKIRPTNFPDKRIKGISNILAKTVKDGLVNFFMERIKQEIKSKKIKNSLKKIMDFKGIGIQRKEEMFFNIIMPFIMVSSKDKSIQNFLKNMFENCPPLSDNKLIKSFKKHNPEIKITSVKTYMGALLFEKQKYEDGRMH